MYICLIKVYIHIFSPLDYHPFIQLCMGNIHTKIWFKEKHLQESRASKTTGGKNPIHKHQILKCVHRAVRRALSGQSVKPTAMIQREKDRYLVLKVWQQLAGFESSLKPPRCLLCPPSEDDAHWFAQSNYSAGTALIDWDVISRRPNKFLWCLCNHKIISQSGWSRKQRGAVVLRPILAAK